MNGQIQIGPKKAKYLNKIYNELKYLGDKRFKRIKKE